MPVVFSRPAPPIAALQGASSMAIQERLAEFAAQMKEQGLRVVGVVEESDAGGGGACGRLALRDLATGDIIPISQNLGAGSTACNLDPRGLAAACSAVEHAITRGADLVVLSKFGKQEVARGGLSDAFRAAFLAGVPLATAVSPAVAREWIEFAGDCSQFIDVSADSLTNWWVRVCAAAFAATAA